MKAVFFCVKERERRLAKGYRQVAFGRFLVEGFFRYADLKITVGFQVANRLRLGENNVATLGRVKSKENVKKEL